MLEVNQLTKSFGNRIAVDHLNFNIASGEVLCLLGANGAGKTTMLNMLLGFTASSSGSATLEGFDLYQQASLCRQKIMYVPKTLIFVRVLMRLKTFDIYESSCRYRYAGKPVITGSDC